MVAGRVPDPGSVEEVEAHEHPAVGSLLEVQSHGQEPLPALVGDPERHAHAGLAAIDLDILLREIDLLSVEGLLELVQALLEVSQ